MKASSMLVPSTTHRNSFTLFLFLFCPDFQPRCERYASFPHGWAAGRRGCRPEGLDSWTRSSRFVTIHLPLWDTWWIITTGWDGTSALLNGPNLLYQIIDRFSPHVIANVFMGHIHDEVRYIYYAYVKYRIILPRLDLLLHNLNVETMVPSWTALPRWPPLGLGALLPLCLDWTLVRVYVPQLTLLLNSIGSYRIQYVWSWPCNIWVSLTYLLTPTLFL